MTADELREALETELAWRQEEYALCKNQQNDMPQCRRGRYRRGLVLILYAQMEGYLKICLQTYIQYINAQRLTGGQVSVRLLAAGMRHSLTADGSKGKSTRLYRKWLQDDCTYHFYQQVDCMEKAEALKEQILKLDDQLVDAGSVAGYDALQKNLYQLGLPVDLFDRYQKDLDALANHKDAIAQGIVRSGVTRQELAGWESKAGGIASGVMRLLYDYVKHEKYRIRNGSAR